MPPSLQWLHTLKAKQLQTLAAAVGTNTTGTKPTLIASLESHLPLGFFPQPSSHPSSSSAENANRHGLKTTPNHHHHEIISIDMGIRNLAYCRISLPPSWPSSSFPSALPTITAWSRIAISTPPPPSSSTSSQTPTTPPTREPFDPLTFSTHAYNLALHLLFPKTPPLVPTPTQILIERQRFRSMGGSAVQEWTLRVNMFEAMLYAVLKTLGEEGRWDVGGGGGGVWGVEPGRVGRFWEGGEGVGDGDETRPKGERGKPKLSNSAKTKLWKIKLVEGWLEDVLSPPTTKEGRGRGKFRLEGHARGLGEGFLRKRKGGRDVRVWQESVGVGEGWGGEEREIGKLDDLADALLQGMAWVQWEENRRRVVEGGVGALGGL